MQSKKKKTIVFGLHLMVDAYNCDPKSLSDANGLYKLLNDICEKLEMKPMIKPYLVLTDGNDKKDPGGWSGFLLIEESHISFHTFVKRKFVTVDLYSCKEFDTKAAISYLQKFFKTKDMETYIETRGKKYPAENID